MDLDVLYGIDVPRPWHGAHPYGRRAAEQRTYREAVWGALPDGVWWKVRLADRMGFRTAWAVERHFREGRSHCPAPEVLLGHLAGLTERIRLGFGVTLTPFGFTPPQRIAEKAATVDVLSGGRVEWGTGRSAPMEQTAFGVDRERSREDWAEALGIVTGTWREEYFEYASERFRFPRRMVTPKPVQDPHPPAWMAATSPGSAEVAGAAGLGLLSFSIMQPLEAVARQVAAYRAAARAPRPLTDVTTYRVGAYTLVHATAPGRPADPRVWSSVAWWYENLARFTLEWELPHLAPGERDRAFPLLAPILGGDVPVREFDEGDMILIGDAETIVTKARRYADLGVDQADVDPGRAAAAAGEVGGVPHTADVTRREAVRDLFARAPRLLGGPVGGVVDIVGAARYAALAELDDAGWDRHFDLVLRHAWFAVQYGGAAVAAAGGGTPVFVASVSGLTAAPLHAAYGAAKAALVSLVRSAAVEMGPRGVRVNAVAPGVVWTPRVAALLGPGGRERNAANAPLGRVAETADIASALYFLASPPASYVTGQTLVVDGGVGVKFPYPTIGDAD
ncbi:LLM class flavin-dependent oxidoreductase [Streptomyces sp. NPDC004126]|uniref:LLM class flavin-dependent oxidoreductase n=1 Tax=Streptomyces sp. NPDC004126 TaxID=3390695 RepID=UPI003D035BFF